WPAWAPDGSRVACFGVHGPTESTLETSLYAVAADGIESWELARLSGGVPIYGNWSPRGDMFAALIQRGAAQLSLETVTLARPGQMTSLLKGAPLFWSWSPRGDLLAVHVGGGDPQGLTTRVLLLDAASGRVVREVSRQPGEFRVPVWAPQDDLLAYVEQDADGANRLFLFDVATGEKAPVTITNGATAALWSADGRFLVFGCTSRPGSFVFSQVNLLDLSSGRVTPLVNAAVTGFFWSPHGEALLYLSLDAQRSHLRWHRLLRESGETTELVRFLPSREQMFIFSFFDQYARSHPPVALDGSALAFAGHLFDAEQSDTTPSRIYVLPLDRPGEPRPVAPGHFVCWNPV
ncbi:MAG: hypothetical protein ACRERD_28190, partial [Candidatus Binatia bacterium]